VHCTALVLAALAAACARPPTLAADLLVMHAAIWTGNRSQPDAQALAIIGDRIVDIGSDTAIERWRGPGTQVIDAEGRRVVPGFNDAHVHFAAGAAQLTEVDLRDAPSPAEFARRIGERARNRPGEWILGGQWDEMRWTPAELPTRDLIDDGTNGTPVFVTHVGGQMALANAAALGRAGITEQSVDPADGVVVRDARGIPTGVLKGAAMEAVTRVIPKSSDEERRQRLGRALQYAESLGVTSVQDMNPDPADVAIYGDLAARGELSVRIYVIPIETTWFEQARLGIRRAFGSPLLRLGAVAGDATVSASDQLLTRLMAADHAGLQLCVNTNEAGVPAALDLLSSIVRANGERDRRFRIERAEKASDGEVDRMAPLHAIASIQPAAPTAGATLRRALDRQLRVAMSTDWPAVPLNPMTGLASVATQTPVAAAVAAYTTGSAFAEFQDGAKGTLARGMLADLVVLSEDIFALAPDRIRGVTVLTTIANGKVVHQRRP
jgi:predicted amidohydrolase YtcJ